MSKKIHLIGAGLYNSIIAREFAEKGYEVTIYEERSHIGGNCYDEVDQETGILYHKYGPHILHFSDEKIYSYLSRYDELIPFHHSVKSLYKDRYYQIPINLDTINKFFNIELKPYEVKEFIKKQARLIENPKNMEEKCLSLIGEKLYLAFFREYTLKQWGIDPKDLPASTIARIPVKLNYNSSYYNKPYSYLPKNGFTELIGNIIDKKNIHIRLNEKINLRDIENLKKDALVVFSGALDDLFENKYGELQYRSLEFKLERMDQTDFQGISVINYPELKYPWTRITEPRHFSHSINLRNKSSRTLIIKEYSSWRDNVKDPYYPVNNDENNRIAEKYKKEVRSLGNVYFGGRLGSYRYTDMENTICNALCFCKEFV